MSRRIGIERRHHLIDIFWIFFNSNLLGYGGGPSTFPLVQNEVVNHYEWMRYVNSVTFLRSRTCLQSQLQRGWLVSSGTRWVGVPGLFIALLETFLPFAIAVILLFKFVSLFKNSPHVQLLTIFVQPVIAVLLGVLAYQFFITAFETSGLLHLVILAAIGWLTMYRFKVHPALVIVCALGYGGVFLS